MIIIDGSIYEGGGQILRNSIALSAIYNKDIHIINIRAGRKVPGLRPQHLSCIDTICKLTRAKVSGNYIGSTNIILSNHQPIVLEELRVDIGTAGSITLLLQAILPVLLYKLNKNIKMKIIGGTDVSFSPPLDYFKYVFLPMLGKYYNINTDAININCIRRGTYPIGNGIIELDIDINKLHTYKIYNEFLEYQEYIMIDDSIRPKKRRNNVRQNNVLKVWRLSNDTLTTIKDTVDPYLEDQLVIYSKITGTTPLSIRDISLQSDHTKAAYYVVSLF